MVKENWFIPIYNDLVFKKIFGTKENVRFARELIKEFFNLSDKELENSRIANSITLNKKNINSKDFTLDILFEMKTKELINIEMQTLYDDSAQTKNLLYIMRVLSSKPIKGEDYTKLKGAIQINFVKFNGRNRKNTNVIDEYYIISKKDLKDVFKRDFFRFYVVNIDSKSEIDYTVDNVGKNFKYWVEFIGAETLEEAVHIAKKYPILKEVLEEMKEFCKNKFVYHDKSEEAILLKSQFKNSRKEGYRDGRNDERLEIAKNFLRNTKTSLEDISICTGVEINELRKLKLEIRKYK